MGISVPRFKEKPNGRVKYLPYHVPLEFRGDYKPRDLANFSATASYRTDAYGKVLCFASVKTTGAICERRAINRSSFCGSHGGALHPLDQVVREEKDSSELSRFELFKRGLITMEDLDDEELATSSFRAKDGRLYQPKNLPAAIVNEFTKALYARATTEMQKSSVDAVRTMVEIMNSPAVEPEVRQKSAIFLIERNLGKTPSTVNVNVNAPWEQIFEGIGHERPVGANELERGIVDAEFEDLSDDGTPIGAETLDEADVFQYDVGRLMSTDQPTIKDRLGIPYAPIPQEGISVADSAKRRDPDILAQQREVPDFEYNFTTQTDIINKERRKRFVARNLGVNPDDLGKWKPLGRKEVVQLDGGLIRIIFNSPTI